ncbi:MAG: hypothetical protein LBV53_02230 [Mycoplasmataceae bacterium]|nr:hypothetical protein [Mycoplasmataceae bacterium]
MTQTRLEKYRNYRIEIKNKGAMVSKINEKSEKINNYRKKIDNISKKILSNFSIHEYLTPFFSINNNDFLDVNSLDEFQNSLDINGLKDIQGKIFDIKNGEYSDTKVWAYDESGSFNVKWLERFKEYSSLKSIRENMERSTDKFDYDLDGEIEKVSFEYEQMKQKEIMQYIDNNVNKKNVLKSLYFFSFISCIVLLVIIFIIVLVKDVTPIL